MITAKGIEVHDWAGDVDEDGFQHLSGSVRRDCRIWPWERPQNWRTGDNYPVTKKVSRDRWAWEFLSRNVEFKTEFEALKPLADDHLREVASASFADGNDEFRHPIRQNEANLSVKDITGRAFAS